MSNSKNILLSWLFLTGFCGLGCPSDLSSGGGSGTDGATTGAGDGSTSSADVTGADKGTGEPPGPPPAVVVDCSVEYDARSGLEMTMELPHREVDTSLTCSDFDKVTGDYDIYVYRPDPWPTGSVPWLLLQHGSGQQPGEYEHLIEPLVARGFVVFSADLRGVAVGVGAEEIQASVSQHVRCSLRWIRDVYDQLEGQSPLGSCYGLIGHSQGGSGVIRAAQLEQEQGTGGPVAAVVTMAPGSLSAAVTLPAERSCV